jgi:hypothetical protein
MFARLDIDVLAMSRWSFKIEYGSTAYWLGVALLVVVLLLVLAKVREVWWEIHDVEEPDSPDDRLRAFQIAHAAGELDDAEFERVQKQLGKPAPPGPVPEKTKTLGDGPSEPAK